LSAGGPLTEIMHQHDIAVHSAAVPQWVANIRNDRTRARVGLLFTAVTLWLLLWRNPPQVLHFFLPAAYIVGGAVAMFSPVRCKIMSRRSLNHYQLNHPFFAKVERFLHPRMSLILANSEAVRHDLVQEGVDIDKIRLIYNGVDVSNYREVPDRGTLRQMENIPATALVMTMVANLIPYKGHLDLLEALAKISHRLPENWILLCAGRDDGIGAELENFALRQGISENVRFLGSRSDVAKLLALSDIGLLTSHEEGFSNSVLEGMASGLPMVVTDVGGNAEAVEDGVTGFVVPARSPVALGDAILQLLDASKRAQLGALGKKRATNLFSLEACVSHYEAIYREACASR